MRMSASWRMAEKAALRSSFQICPGISSQPSLANSLPSPGAIFFPIIAASMGMVPEPQQGSTSRRPSLQKESCTMAEARVSLMGAATSATR